MNDGDDEERPRGVVFEIGRPMPDIFLIGEPLFETFDEMADYLQMSPEERARFRLFLTGETLN